MFCRKCGKQMPDGINFCPYCGAAVYNSESQNKEILESSSVSMNDQEYGNTTNPKKMQNEGGHRKSKKLKIGLGIFFALVFIGMMTDIFGEDESSKENRETVSSVIYEYIDVGIEEILRNPEHYEGKKVHLEGYAWMVFGDGSFALSESMDSGKISIFISDMAGKTRPIGGEYVSVWGTVEFNILESPTISTDSIQYLSQ